MRRPRRAHLRAALSRTFRGFRPPCDDTALPVTIGPREFRPDDEAARILAAIVDSSDDAILGKDLDGVILSWNGGAERMYGYAANEMIGRSISRIIPPDRTAEFDAILARIRRGERVPPHETVRIARDGRHVDVSLVVSPIRDAGGQIVGASAIARDVTEQKHAEQARGESEARWRAIVEAAVDGIVLIDASGIITEFNPSAERMFGYTEEEAIGQNVKILMPEPFRGEHDGYVRRYLGTGEKRIIGIGRDVTALRRSGEPFPVHLSVGELEVAGRRHFVGILHDLSARTRLEEQLREQAALVRLGEMAAVIAHEVKNPLTAVRGAVQVIGSRLPPGSRDAPITKEIVARLDALNGLIQDLLMFARTPHPKLVPLDLTEVVRVVADLLGGDPAVARVRVAVEGRGRAVMGDGDLLRIVVQNLIINAAQAMNGSGEVRAILDERGGCQALTIVDEGPGISPEARAKLFQPFHTTKARGTGLGLATAKRLMEAQGGRIAINCPATGGTAVTLELPYADGAPAPASR